MSLFELAGRRHCRYSYILIACLLTQDVRNTPTPESRRPFGFGLLSTAQGEMADLALNGLYPIPRHMYIREVVIDEQLKVI
jgi:hypothetical protein